MDHPARPLHKVLLSLEAKQARVMVEAATESQFLVKNSLSLGVSDVISTFEHLKLLPRLARKVSIIGVIELMQHHTRWLSRPV